MPREPFPNWKNGGVEFEHVEEDYYIFKSCFSDSPRTHVIKGHGEPIIKALMKQIELRKENIKIMDDVTILRLVKENDRVCGAIGCREENLLKIEAGRGYGNRGMRTGI